MSEKQDIGEKDTIEDEEPTRTEEEASEEKVDTDPETTSESDTVVIPEQPEDKSGDDESGESEATGDESTSVESEEEPPVGEWFRELAEKAESVSETTDWPWGSMEFANIELKWEEGPDPKETDISSYRERIDAARTAFEKRKDAHYEEQKRIREENLTKKKDLLSRLKTLIEEENWTATREVNQIRNRWKKVKPLPSGKEEELQPTFERLLKEFESHKVDRIVQKKEKEEENLTGKLLILDKITLLITSLDGETVDWEVAEKELDRYHKQWHKIGRVPGDKLQSTWDRFHELESAFHAKRFELDGSYRQKMESRLSKKRSLIREAEALTDMDDLAQAARKVNKLHRRWKKVGNLPQKEENELWTLFKEATDEFNEVKSENMDQLRDQEQENLEERKKLIEQADAMKESTEWDKTHNAYQKLMKKWKQTGPVPKRMSGKVWKQFKGAMDHFYDRRRDHFKDVRKEQKENLEEKRDVLSALRELTGHDDPEEAVRLAKPLQEKFKNAGYVPIKFKNELWKEYREVCDEIYERQRAMKSAAKVLGHTDVADVSEKELKEIQKKQRNAQRLRREIGKLESELIQMKESLSYFKPSGKGGDSLLAGVRERVEKAENDLSKREEDLDELEREIDRLRSEAG
ncbi:MAG: DUF349 domain-containing protein [Bacteroidota bacterium]